ncbi:MAG: DUF1573 domain-containing protein [Prevotella sp.]|nr:DUF1573 domain-containing protein [Prevotella sp.]
MKNLRIIKIICVVAFCLVTASCSNQTSKADGQEARKQVNKDGFVLIFEEDEYDFGKVDARKEENEFISKDFVFTNDNEKPLIITKADFSCGCVSTKIPDKPILKGEKGIVKVTLDTKQLHGRFTKSVYVKSNAENDVELLRVTGEIKK